MKPEWRWRGREPVCLLGSPSVEWILQPSSWPLFSHWGLRSGLIKSNETSWLHSVGEATNHQQVSGSTNLSKQIWYCFFHGPGWSIHQTAGHSGETGSPPSPPSPALIPMHLTPGDKQRKCRTLRKDLCWVSVLKELKAVFVITHHFDRTNKIDEDLMSLSVKAWVALTIYLLFTLFYQRSWWPWPLSFIKLQVFLVCILDDHFTLLQ